MTSSRRHTSGRRSTGSNKRRRSSRGNGSDRLMWLIPLIAVLFLIGSKCLKACENHDSDTAITAVDGNLTAVITEPTLKEDVISYKAMTISFNSGLHIPNWVSWQLTADHTDGPYSRTNNFLEDPSVEGSATPEDYTDSGYDRGHMAPAGDMKWNGEAMAESFFMTNMAPQAPDLNRGAWNKLEQKTRERAIRDSVIYIVCGPVLTDSDAIVERIGRTGVAVPRRFFKVILSPYSDPPRAIGFIMPNATVRGGMQAAAMSVDEVEAITGHDFFSALPDSIENQLESTYNFNLWSQLK